MTRQRIRSIAIAAAVTLVLAGQVSGITAAADVSYPVVDSGQVTCYDARSEISCAATNQAFFGQDAQHDGLQPAYRDNGDATVSDLNTGLMWQQGFADSKLTYDEALDYVDSMNAQGLAGYNDWRLPTIKQLYSLIDFRGTDPVSFYGSTAGLVPFLDTDYFDFAYGDTASGERVIDSQWATTSLYVADNNLMFGVNFADGRIKGYGRNAPMGEKTFYVRLCRSASDYGTNSFVDNGDGTVSDRATGLMWAQDDSGQGMTWEDTLAWAEEMNEQGYLGYGDWRVPNAKELHSILDYTRSPDTSGSAAIDPLFDATPISNVYGATDYPFYWSSTTFLRSDYSAGAAVYLAFGRGLGYMNGQFVDIHGAGCQRSDPKHGDERDYPSWGNGPQGDIQRVFNHVRLVRDAESTDPVNPGGSAYTYWVEIAANLAGQGDSRWLTDLAIHNLSAADAEITVVLHSDDGEHSLSNVIPGSNQGVFEDIVELLGTTGKGALEIRSEEPLAAVARIYNQDGDGTFGQFLDAVTPSDGLSTGEDAWLLGLRQLAGSFRTNISVTNTGSVTATVSIELYATDGTLLHTYRLSVEPSQVEQDVEPFSARAGRSYLGWGFARVNLESGSGVLSSASVIDSRTGDATTVAMKR